MEVDLAAVRSRLERVRVQNPLPARGARAAGTRALLGLASRIAIGRLPGWIAHWLEMHKSPTKRICRPRQVYTGATERNFVPIEKRGS